MAEKRMLTKKVTDDDNFMSLSASAQALYLHLSMSADDDGFCNQISASMFKAHASVQDLEALLSKRYIYQFENGVIVIKHWRMANALRKDRYTPTAFQEELKRLRIKENGAYTMSDDGLVADWLPNGCQMVAERLPDGCHLVATDKNSIDKSSIDKNSIEKEERTAPSSDTKHIFGEYRHVLLTDGEIEKLNLDFGETKTKDAITFLDEYIEMKGYKAKSHYLAIRKWVFDAVDEAKQRKQKSQKSESPKNDSFSRMENSQTDYEALFGSGRIGSV
jgi:hypothetical protein